MGQFSWFTQDTNEEITIKDDAGYTIDVYMVNPLTGESYKETDYKGYGIFGGKDYYELLAEINKLPDPDRYKGIDLAYNEDMEGNVIYPMLLSDPSKYKEFDMYVSPESDPNQGWGPSEDENNDENNENYNKENEDNFWESTILESINKKQGKHARS